MKTSHIPFVVLLCLVGVSAYSRLDVLKRISWLKLQAVGIKFSGGYDFNKMIVECRKTSIYTPAVLAATEWLESGTTLTSAGITSVIKIYGLANLVCNLYFKNIL